MNHDVRGDPSAIDAAWMTEALEEAGVARGATVTALECTGFIGTGQMSRNARFHLEWDHPGRPVSAVGKFPSTDPPTKASSFENGAYLSEVGFYTEIAPTVDVRTPACWVARYDDRIPDFVLIMEDLAGSVQGDQFTGSTVDETELAIEQAVNLHSPVGATARSRTSLHSNRPVATAPSCSTSTTDIAWRRASNDSVTASTPTSPPFSRASPRRSFHG